MNKIIYFLLIMCFKTYLFSSIDNSKNFSEKPKYILSICALFKNEAKYLKEWIEYHRLVGVDHFYLYNVGSGDHFHTILQPYLEKKIVTLVQWPEAINLQNEDNAGKWALSTQIPAYENAVNFLAKGETEWLILLDISEYLVCPIGNIIGLLNEYTNYSAVTFPCDFFDASDFSSKKLLIQSVNLSGPPKKIIEKSVSKMIFKPDHCAGFIWPPYKCRFKTPNSTLAVNRQLLRLNHYINRNALISSRIKPKLEIDNRAMSEAMISNVLSDGNLIEDQDRPIYLYIPELLKRMRHK